MMAMEMKATGIYLSRGLSYRQAEVCLAVVSIEIDVVLSANLVYF